MSPELSEQDMVAFEPEAKIGLLATRSPEGLPHVTLITTLQARGPTELMWGQFCAGTSKNNVEGDPRAGFLVMNADKEVWRGTARWTGTATEGDDYVKLNQTPMFRYNSYLGIHKVHYMDLVGFAGQAKLSMPGVVAGSLLTSVSRRLAGRGSGEAALKPWAASHIGKLGTLKFVSVVGADGYPTIIPVVPTHVVDRGRLVIAPTVYADELAQIPAGARVAVFALNLEMESVLVRGSFSGLRRYHGLPAGTIDIDWVYNSMPPKQGQVFPEVPLEAARTS